MLLTIETDITDHLEVVQEVANQVKNTNPDKIKAYFESLLPGVVNVGLKIVLAVVIYFIGSRIIKFLRKILRKFLQRSGVETGVQQFLDSFLKAALYFILIMVICSMVGIPTASVVALLGSAGLAIGLALQGSLSNFAGGVLILLLKPFRVGDYIIEHGNGKEGTVTEIQLFYTKLLTVDNRVIVIPNGILSNSSLTNVTAQEKRRVDLFVDIAYEADIRKAKELLTKVAGEEVCRLQDEEITVFVDSLQESSVRLGCRVWVKKEDYWDVKWRLTENCKYAFDKEGINIPFQQMEISIKNQSLSL